MAKADSRCLKELIFVLINEVSCQNAIHFQPRPSDVIIVTPPKCGSTWMQQITHQLRTGGDMDFDGISEVVPWMEVAYDRNYDLEKEQRATPRLYKCHLPHNDCPKGCRYIAVYRNPCSAAYSFYKFKVGAIFSDNLSVDEFITGTWLTFGDPANITCPIDVSYFTHLLDWMVHRNDPNVLVLFYEEMKEDLEAVVRAVASFLSIHDEQKIRVAVEKSSFEFMKSNGPKFNEKPFKPGVEVLQNVRTGSADEALEVLSEDTKAVIQQRWETEISGVTGYNTYEELRRGIRKERPLAY